MEIDISTLIRRKYLCRALLQTKIFVYPTDTVYGIGCNAENSELVKKILKIKKRSNSVMSVIAPSFLWIKKNFYVKKCEKLIKKCFPGPYTLIFKLKKENKDYLKHISKNGKIGVRIPNHEISIACSLANLPIITTSANISGNKDPTNISEIDKDILGNVDLIITQKNSKCTGTPSTIIDCEKKKIIRSGSGKIPKYLKF